MLDTYYSRNRKRLLAKARAYYWVNKERKAEYDRQYAEANRDKRRACLKRWRDNHPDRKRAETNARRKKFRVATPKWADLKSIRKFYLNCPKGYHVDHIIPLTNKLVSGLHVLGNLQYLPALDNLIKKNKYVPL